MKLLLKRKFKGDTYTIGDLFVDGKFFCNTIEDRVRLHPKICPDTLKGISCKCKEKVYAQTAIPAGEYKVTMVIQHQYGVAADRFAGCILSRNRIGYATRCAL